MEGGGAGAASPSAAAQSGGIPTGHKFGGIQTEFTDDVVKDGAGCRFVLHGSSTRTLAAIWMRFLAGMGIFIVHVSEFAHVIYKSH